MPESRPCPVCDALERKLLYHQQFFEGVLGDGYDVVVCGNCGAGFADFIPKQSELDRYYAEQSKYTYSASGGAESAYDLRRFETIVDQLAPFIAKTARILDIGCATGGLLAAFKRRGFLNVLGADPSPICATAAQKLYNIEVWSATLAEVASWTKRFDLVLMVGVLEHLREVKNAVRWVSNLLTSGGLYYAAVPDVEGLAKARNAPFQQFSMEHVNFFSRQSLDGLLGVCGFAPQQSWQYQVEWRQAVTEPIIAGLYILGSASPLERDVLTKRALENYIIASGSADAEINQLINKLVEKREPIFVWGTGALTRRLLFTTSLNEVKIVAFVDSYRDSERPQLAGRKIILPNEIAERQESILICSVAFKNEIIQLIRGQYKIENKIYTLGES